MLPTGTVNRLIFTDTETGTERLSNLSKITQLNRNEKLSCSEPGPHHLTGLPYGLNKGAHTAQGVILGSAYVS
jgi:hypothetical protein